MARFLVTGGCGFIGSHLVDDLVREGHEVCVLDDLSSGTTRFLPPGVRLLQASVTDREAAREAIEGIDGCFHLAAIASVQRSAADLLGTHAVNLGGTLTLLDALGRAGRDAGFVYASSAAVYGDVEHAPTSEHAPKRPITPYGADKRGCELHARVASRAHGLACTGLRFFNVYGPRQPPDSPYSGVVSIFADRLARDETLHVYGDGLQSRDLVHVGDIVIALRRAMERRLPGAPVFNVCTGRAVTVLDLTVALGDALGRTPRIEHRPARPGDIRHSVGDPTAARAALGLPTPLPLEAGLPTVLTRP